MDGRFWSFRSQDQSAAALEKQTFDNNVSLPL